MTELTLLKNIGKEMARKLKSVGINSAEDLKSVGSKKAFSLLKSKYPGICTVHLYALQGAVSDLDFNCLSEETKRDLKDFSDKIRRKDIT